MRKAISGFTIVEILIVITVIGILASIVIVSYSGSRNNAQNASRLAELKAWQKSFVQYKATNGVYPDVVDGGYCLGTGFPSQKCRDYTTVGPNVYTEASSVGLMTLLSTYDAPKSSPRVPVNGSVGPYVEYYSTIIHLTDVFNGIDATNCPAGTYYVWGDGTGRILCRINLNR